ncbi:MAG TPA: hypothetical protein VIN61_07090 [Gammaproteobacteria bacterium]
MTIRTLLPLAVGCLSMSVLPDAQGQLGGFPGLVSLPRDDFTWIWGDQRDGAAGGFEDFSVTGHEAGFNCELTGKLHPASRLTPADVRDLEQQLRSSLAFIQAAAEAMYILDQRREIDWAKLDCDKPEPREPTAEESAERVNRALERARREQAERRERQQRRGE